MLSGFSDALTSSPNFSQDDLGEPVLQTVLEPGDLLYFPRGFIHQAECQDGVHSLHLTLSTFQRNTWGDFLEAVLPLAVQAAMEENVEFRRGLPYSALGKVFTTSCPDYCNCILNDHTDQARTKKCACRSSAPSGRCCAWRAAWGQGGPR